jgi:peptidoglycan/xylan/chitin deacetylase (PgdA/CDA1 family)
MNAWRRFTPSIVAGSLLSPSGSRGRLFILIYHRVLGRPDSLLPTETDAAVFETHICALASHFNLLPLAEAVKLMAAGALPARAACITFDDGYADNVDVALPILTRYGAPATFFIATAFLDGGRMWNDTVIEAVRRAKDELDLTELGLGRFELGSTEQRRSAIDSLLPALKYLPQSEREQKVARISQIVGAELPDNLMMRSEHVRYLHQRGMEIGAHTASHPILARLDDAAARIEIVSGRERLEQLVGAPVRLFAYPNGKPGQDYLGKHVSMVKELGFTAAVSTSWGVAGPGSDLFQLPRFTPWDKTPLRFVLRLFQNRMRRAPVLV